MSSRREKQFGRGVYKWIRDVVNIRDVEIKKALTLFQKCERVLDVGCGTGRFLSSAPKRFVGLDLNEKNVEICVRKGLDARVGNALSLPFDDNTFDGVYASHVLHVFSSADCREFFREVVRVTKPGGVIGIATIADSPRSWIHAENARPYPPGAIRGLFLPPNPETESSPMPWDLPTDVRQRSIWLRRPALFEIIGHRSHTHAALGALLNGIQYKLLLRKYWTFNAYIIELKNSLKTNRANV